MQKEGGSQGGKAVPRIHDEDSRGLGQIQSHTSRLEWDQKDLNVIIVHEILNRPISGFGGHVALQTSQLEPSKLKPTLN